MTLPRFLALAVALAVFSPLTAAGQDPKQDDPVKKEQAKLEGTWTVKSLQQGGESLPDEVIKSLKVVIKGDAITTFNGDKKVVEVTYRVDPGKDPKTIEWKQDGKVIANGTYVLDKDLLLLNMATTGDKARNVMQLQRDKP